MKLICQNITKQKSVNHFMEAQYEKKERFGSIFAKVLPNILNSIPTLNVYY